MSKYRRTSTAPSRDSFEHLDTLKPSVSISEPMLKIPMQDRRKSTQPNNRSTGGSGNSIQGVMGARRYSRRLSSKSRMKREDTQGSSLNIQSVNIKQLEPTYKLEPDVKFSAKSVEDIIKDILNRRLRDYKYDRGQTPIFGKILSDDIKERVKKLNFERYKIVCYLVIGENRGQGLQMSSRCQWFPSTDTYASYNYKNASLFCSCTVYGIYAE
ncbi:dynein light chain Tctex-type 5-B-like [Saccostrea echinata]|uniref:dynein light chain Tctex-type 5-B-like n=1 Tax=Saccostrea echinata TaxID=191078 RepID=UPI002A83AB65|nr:dynein light chain Tctex-type 5-B-like [Saccostrea echinata]